jgi:hypothetical protein
MQEESGALPPALQADLRLDGHSADGRVAGRMPPGGRDMSPPVSRILLPSVPAVSRRLAWRSWA